MKNSNAVVGRKIKFYSSQVCSILYRSYKGEYGTVYEKLNISEIPIDVSVKSTAIIEDVLKGIDITKARKNRYLKRPKKNIREIFVKLLFKNFETYATYKDLSYFENLGKAEFLKN